jgi:hypothetical protein
VIDNMGDLVQLDESIVRILRMFRIFRILRAFRIFKALKSLQELVATIFKSLPSMANLVAFLMLFFFIWSVLGVVLYGNMCMSGEEDLEPLLRSTRCLLTDQDAVLPLQAHFQSVEWTLISLFRISTGDAWGDVMTSLQLSSGGRGPVEEDVWEYYSGLLDQDSASIRETLASQRQAEVEFSTIFQKQAEDAQVRMQLAALSLTRWNASATGVSGDDNTDGWAASARLALPGCLTAGCTQIHTHTHTHTHTCVHACLQLVVRFEECCPFARVVRERVIAG